MDQSHSIARQIVNCEAKRAYRTRGQALISAYVIRDTRNSIQEPYRCPICGEWHLTSKGVW